MKKQLLFTSEDRQAKFCASMRRLHEGDVRTEKLEDIYRLLRGYTKAHARDLEQNDIDADDFIQDVVTSIFTRRGLDNYDPSKVQSWEALIFRIAKNRLIDKIRWRNAKSRLGPDGKPMRVSSMNQRVGDDKGAELGDFIPDHGSGEESEVDPTDYLMVEPDGTLMVSQFKVTPEMKEKAVEALRIKMKKLGIKSLADFSRMKSSLTPRDSKLITDLIGKVSENNPTKMNNLHKLNEIVRTFKENADLVAIEITSSTGTRNIMNYCGTPAEALAKAKEQWGKDYTVKVATDFMPKAIGESLFPVKVTKVGSTETVVSNVAAKDAVEALALAKKQFGDEYEVEAS